MTISERVSNKEKYLPCMHLSDGWCWPCVDFVSKIKMDEAYENAAKICEAEQAKYEHTTGHRAGLALQADLLKQKIRALKEKK